MMMGMYVPSVCCTTSDPKKMSICDKRQLQYYTDCIDMHTCHNLTLLSLCN